MKRKAHGAQEPRHILKYFEVTNTAQRSDSPARAINQRFLTPSNKILFNALLYGIGDNLVLLGILKYLRDSDPDGNKYYLVIGKKKFQHDLFRPFFKNVLLVDDKRFQRSTRYRRDILKKINEHHFESAVECRLRPRFDHPRCVLFDEHNTNIQKFHFAYHYLEKECGQTRASSAFDRVEPMARHVFGIPAIYNLDSKGLLAEYLQNIQISHELPSRYIAVSFGGASWEGCYQPEKVAVIVNHFIKSGYNLVLLGAGKADVKLNSRIIKLTGKSDRLRNFTNLDLYSSFKAIQQAELFVGMDSGLAHAAYSLDKKAVVLRAADSESNWFEHIGDKNMVYLKTSLPCSVNCIGCVYPKERRGECIAKIDPADVIAAMERFLGSN
jgi:ADP-heptose:LPS heptosyltransferase